MKRRIGYLILIMLVMLLLLPPFLRRFSEDSLEKVEIKGNNDVIAMLSCSKIDEVINTSYLNNDPYNLQYKIKGNYLNLSDELNEEIFPEQVENTIIEQLKDFANASYDNKKDLTIYKINLKELPNIPEKLQNYSLSMNKEIEYYEGLGFICNINR